MMYHFQREAKKPRKGKQSPSGSNVFGSQRVGHIPAHLFHLVLLAAAHLSEQRIDQKQLCHTGRHRAQLQRAFVGPALQDHIRIGAGRRLGEMGHQDSGHAPLVSQLQQFHRLAGGAGIGKEQDGVPGREGGDRHDLDVGIAQRKKAHTGRGKDVGRLLCHDHRTALAHAQHLVRPGQKVGRPDDLPRPDQGQGLGDGVHLGAVQLMAHLLDVIVRGHFAAEERDAPAPGHVVGQGQLEGIVSLIPQLAAKPGDGGLGHAAGFGQV